MAFSYTSGHRCPVKWQPNGLGVAVLNVKSHNVDISVLLFDVSNTGTGVNTARLSGKRDGAGTVNYSIDADLPPYLTPPFLIEGVSGVFLKFYTPNNAIQIPGIIEKMHYEAAMTTESLGSFDQKMNSLAGFYVLPSVPG